jgi:hypothetical protein
VGDYSHPYPYGDTNPVTIPIESDYLLDVVPQELPTYYHPNALQAQAAAARSYAFWHINQGSNINNSNEFQVFVPYRFESLPPATFPDNTEDPCASSNLNTSQRIVCDAVAPRYYIAYEPEDDMPAFTEFSSDAWARTAAGGYPYLMAVDNPISTGCDANDFGHQRGMSQEGASRWAWGNRCSYPGQGDDPWSVHWERAEQTLVHYYTGVHIRDANDNNARITPTYRWNPLRINWGTPDNSPPDMYHGGDYPISVQVQNTGTYDWNCTYPNYNYELKYRWAKAGHTDVTGSSADSVCGQTMGDPSLTKNLIISDIPEWGCGAYTLRLDIYVSSTAGDYWFGDLWPSYDVTLCVDGPCKAYMPAVFRNYGPAWLVSIQK